MFWVVTVMFTFPFHSAMAQSPQDIQQLFEVDKIVPDLLPSFDPSTLLEVTYNATIIPGQILSQNGIDPEHHSLTLQPRQCAQTLGSKGLPQIPISSF
jgi:hypothetical protein